MKLPIISALAGFLLAPCITPASANLANANSSQADFNRPPAIAAAAAQPFNDDPPSPFAVFSSPGPVVRLAHAILVKANPVQEASLSATDVPEEVVLIFNDSVGQDFLALAVIDPSGKRVDNHDAKLDFTDHSHLRASVSKLAPGRYTVRYRVLSADGHVVSGKFFFDVQGE